MPNHGRRQYTKFKYMRVEGGPNWNAVWKGLRDDIGGYVKVKSEAGFEGAWGTLITALAVVGRNSWLGVMLT